MRARGIVLALGCALAHAAPAQAPAPLPPGTPLAFQACPVAQDTGPDTDLCFFTEHAGVRIGLRNPPDWGQPQLKHRVLVEGTVSDGASVCGGIAFEGRFSVLAELDHACATVMPYDGKVPGVATGVFNSGTPEQRAAAMALAERAVAEPALSLLPAIPEPPPPSPPAAPYRRQRFTVYYPFDSDRGSGPDMLEIMRLVRYALAADARIALASYQGSSLLDDGTRLTERAGTARRRGEKLRGILLGLGLPAAAVALRWEDRTIEGDGIDDWRGRRIDLELIPRD